MLFLIYSLCPYMYKKKSLLPKVLPRIVGTFSFSFHACCTSKQQYRVHTHTHTHTHIYTYIGADDFVVVLIMWGLLRLVQIVVALIRHVCTLITSTQLSKLCSGHVYSGLTDAHRLNASALDAAAVVGNGR